jgi:hypothetical protein
MSILSHLKSRCAMVEQVDIQCDMWFSLSKLGVLRLLNESLNIILCNYE